MIYLKSANIIHVMKTGGTWRLRAAQALPKGWFVKHVQHQSFADLPEERKSLPTYAFVRNPWDWEVSMYFHLHTNVKYREGEFKGELCVERQRMRYTYGLPFDDVVRSEEKHVRRLHRQLDSLLGEARQDATILRFEDGVRRQFQEIVERHHGSIPNAVRQTIGSIGAINARDHGSVSGFYTAETKKLVAVRYREIIERFGYECPF